MKQKKTIAQRVSPKAPVVKKSASEEKFSDMTDKIRKGIYPDPRQIPLF